MPFVYKKVTSLSDIVDGGVYIVVDEVASKAMGGIMKTRRAAVDVEKAADLIGTNKVNVAGYPYEMTLRQATKGTYNIELSNGKYLKKVTSGNGISEDTSKKDSNEWRWDITVSSDETVTVASCSDEARSLRYTNNETDPAFAAYSNEYPPISLYRRVGTFEVKTAEGFATYYSDKSYTMPEGVVGTTITCDDVNAGEPQMQWEYEAGSVVPANTGLLLKGQLGATYTAPLLNDQVSEAPAGNCLKGTTEDKQIESEDGMRYYKLAYSTIDGKRTLGFFWGADNGAAFMNGANKAYLVLPHTTAFARGFSLVTGDVTGVGDINVVPQNEEDAPIYTISGTRVHGSLSSQPKGIYIIKGKKVYVK